MGGIGHVGLGFHQPGEAFDIHLGGDQIRNGVDEPANRLHHALGVIHEHGEGAHFIFGNVAALPEHDGQRQGRGHIQRGGEHAAQMGHPDALFAHGAGIIHKILGHFVFNHQGFDGLGAGDAFVEIAGDAAVEFAHFPVDFDEPGLEEGKENHNQRQNSHDHQGQPCIHRQHHHHGAHKVGKVPHRIHQ